MRFLLASSTMSAEAEKLKVQANALYKARNFEEAVSVYDQAITAFPYDLTFYTNKAAALLEWGKPEEGLAVLEHALSMKSDILANNRDGATYEKISKVYIRQAACYLKQNLYDQAISAYQRALTEQNTPQTRTLLREAESAKDAYLKSQYFSVEKSDFHREEGNKLFKEGKYPEAKIEYDEAIKRNPKDPKGYSNRAAAYTKLLAYPDALRDLDECLKLDKNFIKAYSRKGAALFFMKDYNKALQAYDQGLAIDANNQECLKGRQQVLEKIQQMAGGNETDPDQVNRAMADPEIQSILRDPQINLILQQLQENPKKAMDSLKDPKVANAIQKLMAAGILKTK
jgi:stress-induced-phosphoprotein 1